MSEKTPLQHAYQHHQQGDLELAKNDYYQVLADEPDNDEANHLLGLLYLQQSKLDKAIYRFKKAIALSPMVAAYHSNLAQAYKQKEQFALAIEEYTLAIDIKPDYAQALNNLGSTYQAMGKLDKALHFFVKSTHAQFGFMPAHENVALVLIRMGNIEAAEQQCKTIITLDEDSFIGHYYLSVIYLNKDLLDKAKTHLEEALRAQPTSTDCLNNLGTIALKQQAPQLAIDYFTKALAFDNDNIEARNNLAATFIQYDRYENAVNHYLELLRTDEKNLEYNYNMGVAHMNLGRLDEAVHYFETVIKYYPKNSDSFVNLAAITRRQGKKDQSRRFLEQAVALNPLDESATYMLDALHHKQSKRAPIHYVTQLFDNYAVQYDSHLVNTLNYQVPSAIASLLHTLCEPANGDLFALDLGCGTGLAGEVIKPYCRHLIGIDLSQKMLDIAHKKGLYQQLFCIAILPYLKHCEELFDLMLAADVLPYFGCLDTVFHDIQPHLRAGGRFIFSIEHGTEPGYSLQDNARFKHHPDYIEALAAEQHYRIEAMEPFIARVQAEKPVKALLYSLVKTDEPVIEQTYEDDSRE